MNLLKGQKELEIEKKADLKNAKDNMQKCQKELNFEIQKEEEMQILKNKLLFCEKTLAYVKNIREEIMTETKFELETITKEHFFNLIWKKETYENIVIDDNYNVSLINNFGNDCLGSAGAAVRQFLALSFTLALHKVSGFEAQLIIDTPVGRASDKHRENFGDLFRKVSKEKQVILLFTPAEYSEDISNKIDYYASNRFEIKMTPDENETLVEDLK